MLNRPELLAPLEIFMMIQKLGYSLPLLVLSIFRLGYQKEHWSFLLCFLMESLDYSSISNLAINHPLVSYSSSEFHHSLIELFFCHGTKTRKEYPMLTCGPPSLSTVVPRGEGEDGESRSEDENSEKNQMVCISDRNRPKKKQKITRKGKGRD
ncbi:hypothetical protein NC652_024520 [Populus alba x Populus x berolinensis]|nr:hypothetical protein NC652_024509 [Populus alba x Populus x berolinensis]KAJ6897727.1 hypothetical protein NC652_024520 [Populus alba x Populus x berolinensis]